jgi:hypothetical protein
MTTTYTAAGIQRPTIRMRHMSMTCGGGFADRPTDRTFANVEDANQALIALAMANDHAVGGVIVEPDPFSLVTRAFHTVIH